MFGGAIISYGAAPFLELRVTQRISTCSGATMLGHANAISVDVPPSPLFKHFPEFRSVLCGEKTTTDGLGELFDF